MLLISRSVCSKQVFPVKSNVYKIEDYPSRAPGRSSLLRVALGFNYKYQTWLGSLASNKHSILLGIFVNYSDKKLHKIVHCFGINFELEFQSRCSFKPTDALLSIYLNNTVWPSLIFYRAEHVKLTSFEGWLWPRQQMPKQQTLQLITQQR